MNVNLKHKIIGVIDEVAMWLSESDIKSESVQEQKEHLLERLNDLSNAVTRETATEHRQISVESIVAAAMPGFLVSQREDGAMVVSPPTSLEEIG